MSEVNKCGSWAATLFVEQNGHHRLKIHGQCTFPTPGFKVHLKKKEPQGINPAILILERTVVPPTGIEPQHVVTIPVSFEERTRQHYDEVQIVPDGVRIEVKEARASDLQHSSTSA
jgi:hypothetical protein